MTDKGIPKSRREGSKGGMKYSGTQAASAKRGGDPGRFGGPPPKKGCLLIVLALAALPVALIAAGAAVVL